MRAPPAGARSGPTRAAAQIEEREAFFRGGPKLARGDLSLGFTRTGGRLTTTVNDVVDDLIASGDLEEGLGGIRAYRS